MGGKGSGSQTSTTTSSLPPEVIAAYQNVTGRAQNVSENPLQQYQGNIVAPFSNMQNQAFGNINSAQGAYQPYFNQAQGLIGQGTQQYTPTAFSPEAISQYENPYTQDVINSTMANINQNNAEQQSALQGNAIARGAWGGDRADLARNDLARQQNLASGQTIAGLENQKYQQALGQFNTQNQTGLQAAGLNSQTALQGAGLQGAMGNYAQANQLNAANAQLAGGSLQQQLAQAQLMVPYQQFQQQQAYPFQTTQYLANIVEGLGNQGGTSTTTQPSQAPNSIFGFLGLKDGGKVGYAKGGIVPNGYYPGGPVGEMNPFGIPDLSQSYVPLNQPTITQSSIPQAPHIDQQQKKQANLGDLISTGKNLSAAGNWLGSMMGPTDITAGIGAAGSSAAGFDAAAAGMGSGATALDLSAAAAPTMFAADAAGTAAATAPEWLTALMAFLKTGGAVKGYENGGPIKYAGGGWQQQPLFDSPMYSTPQSIMAENNGILPSGGQVGGLPLSPSMNNQLAGLLSDPSLGSGLPTNSLSDSGMSSDIVAKLAALNANKASPNTMDALNSGIQTAQKNPISNGIAIAQNSIPAPPTMSGQPQQSVIDQPPALTDLQSALAKNAPVLDKDAAIWTGIAGALAGKNRGILQNVGEGLQAGLGAYGQQKAAVAEYALKQAEAEKRAEQLAVEADRYNKQLEIEQQNADTNKQYKEIAAKVAEQNATTKEKAATPGDFSNYFKDPTKVGDAMPTGNDLSNNLKPEINSKLDRILDGGDPKAVSTRKDQRDDLLTLAHLKDPSYDEANYANRAAAMKAYNANGNVGKEFASFNTIMQHGPMAIQQGNDLANQGIWTPGNKLSNVLLSNTGDSRVKVLQDTLNTIASEKAKMLNATGVVTDSAREESVLEGYDTPQQLNAEITNVINQVKARANVRQQQYIDDVNGHNSDYQKQKADSFIQPEARKQLNKLGIPINNFYGQKDESTVIPAKNFGLSADDLKSKEGKFFNSGGNRYQILNGQVVKVQ